MYSSSQIIRRLLLPRCISNKLLQILTNTWLVIIVLNAWSLLINDSHVSNSNRIIIPIDEPDIPAQKEKIR